MSGSMVCSPKYLPTSLWVAAAQRAIEINPVNHPRLDRLTMLMPDFQPTRERIAVVTTKYWHTRGVNLSVQFLDNPPQGLRNRILSHMYAWNKSCNVKFSETRGTGQVRIARTAGDGYWSYVGTDILSIADDQPTMNLDSFAMDTPESEY